MSKRAQRDRERVARLREAEDAQGRVARQGQVVESQLSLVGKLSDGWRKVHEFNHLADLFQPQPQEHPR